MSDEGVVFMKNWEDTVPLLCPICSDTYMHHGRVIVKNRPCEDGDGNVVKVNGPGGLCAHHIPKEQIEGRRSVVWISFSCENCDSKYGGVVTHWLQIIQHKGQTFFSWTEPGQVPLGEEPC